MRNVIAFCVTYGCVTWHGEAVVFSVALCTRRCLAKWSWKTKKKNKTKHIPSVALPMYDTTYFALVSQFEPFDTPNAVIESEASGRTC